jgi:hypothetical protein
MIQGLPSGEVWLAFKNTLRATDRATKCYEILTQLLVFEQSYAYDRLAVSAYTNTELSAPLFAKKGTGGGSMKTDGKATGWGAWPADGKASGETETLARI